MTDLTLYIDPGVQHCGAALFREDGILEWAGLLKRHLNAHRLSGPQLRALATQYGSRIKGGAVEHMRIRREDFRKGAQDDLIDVAFVAGSVGARLGVFLRPTIPERWKGQVPKDVMVRRIVSKLDKAELARVEWPSKGGPIKGLNHNVADAIGIGLWDKGRLRGV